jgi:asparagine synthase (glutamine-hydrolysing)
MSALGGIHSFGEGSPDLDLLRALGELSDSRGPDGGGEALSGSTAMFYRAFYTTKESHLEQQPFISRNGEILAWDGRLDNRAELAAQLGISVVGSLTDVAIVMACYEKWSTEFLGHLAGDFALALWDSKSRMLLLGRDPIGTRPLFYHSDGKRVVWSSEIGALVSVLASGMALDEEYLASFLVSEADPTRSPYKGISPVPPGSIVLLRNEHFQVRRFWNPDPNRTIRYRSDCEYEEHFRELFHEAIRSRLRADGPVWAQLSGGFDSSSIVCMADEIVGDKKAGAQDLETVSYVFDEASTCDERVFISSVEAKRGRGGFHIREDDYPAFSFFPNESFPSIPNPVSCFAARFQRLGDLMRENGARILLSGLGGDNLLLCAGAATELADLLVQRDLARLHYRTRIWAQAWRDNYFKVLWEGALWPLFPRWIRSRWRHNHKVPFWLDRKFVERTNLRECSLGPSDGFRSNLPTSRKQLTSVLYAIRAVSAGYYRDRLCIEDRYPFLHLPLVEFCMAIPWDQKRRPGEPRSLHRRAMRNILPERIVQRKDKRSHDEAVYRALVREWPRFDRMLADARVCERGFASATALREALVRAKHGVCIDLNALTRTICLEFWLRSLERPRVKPKITHDCNKEGRLETAVRV